MRTKFTLSNMCELTSRLFLVASKFALLSVNANRETNLTLLAEIRKLFEICEGSWSKQFLKSSEACLKAITTQPGKTKTAWNELCCA